MSFKSGMTRAWTLGIAVIACLAMAPSAFAGAVISNGTVRLGVNDRGNLNFGGFGVNYVPTGNDGTRAGCSCEGWGAGAGGPTLFQGRANNSSGISGVTPGIFSSTATTATSTTDVLRSGTPALRVKHEFAPSPSTPNLYEIKITLENLTAAPLTDVRYERIMDWDVEPTAFSEFVTIQRGTTPASLGGDLIYSDDNGFADNLPFTNDGPIDPATVNADYTDRGPTDHGARFTFGFGTLAAGESTSFVLYYGAAGTESTANAAVSAAALELYSYGQPNGGQTSGAPNSFIWGFKAVGGAPIIPPTLKLTPKTATNTVGDPHTVTAELDDSTGAAVPGAEIVFEVTGANPQPAASRTTDVDGKATYTYTGTNTGSDSIKACLDANANKACEAGEITDTASKTWVASAGLAGRMVGEGRLTGGGKTADFAYVLGCRTTDADKKLQAKVGGTTYTLSTVNTVTCTDDPAVTPSGGSGLDTMTGKGTTSGGTVIEWTFVDGGTGGTNDSSTLKITSPSSVVLFNGTGSPPGPFGGGTRVGRNTAQTAAP